MAPPPSRPVVPPRGHLSTDQRQRSSSPVLKWIILFLLGLIVLTGLIVLIMWLAIHPRKLQYSIERGSISRYNLTNDDHLTSNFLFVLRARNPNRRMSFYYDRIDVTVLYEGQTLSVNNIHPFYQPRRNVTYLDMPLVAKSASLYGDVARDMRKEQSSGDVVLDLRIRARIRVKVGVFKIRRTLRAFCGKLAVPFSSNSAYNNNNYKGFERVSCHVEY